MFHFFVATSTEDDIFYSRLCSHRIFCIMSVVFNVVLCAAETVYLISRVVLDD